MKIFILLSASALFFSCSQNRPESDPSVAPATTAAVVKDPAAPVSAPVLQSIPAPTTQTVAAGSSQSTNAGINPAHGLPGHRCDIAVGAPLNSPVKAATAGITQMQAPASLPAAPAPNAAPVNTAPGMNPPHGQPGHRCDISVGAPLNSKPTTTVVPTVAPNVAPAAPVNIMQEGKAPNPTPVAPQK